MERAVQKIFGLGFESYARHHKLPLHQWKAATSLMRCRTSALGGHVQRCENGHVQGVWYNSCRHRWCPQCNALVNERWLDAKRTLLLPCAHRHIIFTIPHDLIPLWCANTEAMAQLLFDAVRETLLVLARDERHLGAAVGMLLALHTWGRSLSLHPHIHALVTEGGLDASGCWREPKRRCFLPARVVMALFRGKFRAKVLEALRAGRLRVPRGESERTVENLLNRLGREKWNVQVQQRYGHGIGVATYLARYVRGGPLRNGQIHRVSAEEVTYRYRSHRSDAEGRRLHTVRTTPGGFIGRYLVHVPALRKKTIRLSGLYSSANRSARHEARAALGAPEAEPPSVPVDWRTFLERVSGLSAPRCARCGAPIHQAEPVPRTRDPPRGVSSHGRRSDA